MLPLPSSLLVELPGRPAVLRLDDRCGCRGGLRRQGGGREEQCDDTDPLYLVDGQGALGRLLLVATASVDL